MVHELYCEPKNGTIMGSFIENINDDFDITTEKEKKKKRRWKNCSKTVPKLFDLSSKNDSVKKIHLCN